MWRTPWKAYLWQAHHPWRQRRQGIRWGKDERSVRLALQIEGYRQVLLRSAFQLPMRRWSAAIQQRWFEQMARLLGKTSLVQALRLMPDLTGHPLMGAVSLQLLSRIESGLPLWKAMHDLHPLFHAQDVAMVRSAEETASLARTLHRIAHEQSQRLNHQRQMQAALAYPLFLLTMAVGSLWAMSVWVIPSFLNQFAHQSWTLPRLTQWVLTIGSFVSTGLPGILLLATLIWLAPHLLNSNRSWRQFRLWLLMRQPASWWTTLSAQAHWCGTLATGLESGLSLSASLHMAAQVHSHPRWQHQAEQISHDVTQGMRLALAIERSALFLPLVWHMADLWEGSGGGADLFQQVADELQRREQQRWKVIAKWSEPLLIVTTGLIMGVMVLAMYLPMFQMGSHL